jgi:hypothetical protein
MKGRRVRKGYLFAREMIGKADGNEQEETNEDFRSSRTLVEEDVGFIYHSKSTAQKLHADAAYTRGSVFARALRSCRFQSGILGKRGRQIKTKAQSRLPAAPQGILSPEQEGQGPWRALERLTFLKRRV